MLRHYHRLLLAMLLLAVSVSAAQAQQSRRSTRRPTTLSERLQQFKDGLIGVSDEEMEYRRSNQRPQMRSPQRGVPNSANARGYDDGQQDASSRTSSQRHSNSLRQGSALGKKSQAEPTRAEPRTAMAEKSEKPEAKLSLPKPHIAKSEPADSAQFKPARRAEPVTPPTTAARVRSAKSLTERLSKARSDEPRMAKKAESDEAAKVEKSDEPVASVARAERPLVSSSARKSEPMASQRSESLPSVKREPQSTAIKRGAGENIVFTSQSPQISVEASGPKRVLVGKEAEFIIKVRNSGDGAANNVAISINIPQFADVVYANATTGTTRAPVGTDHVEPFEWRLNRLEGRSRELLTLRIVPRKSIPLDLAAQWSCSPETSQTLVEVQEPKLMMALAGPQEVLYGQSKIYKLTISNPGNGDAENVLVSLMPLGRASEGTASHKLGSIKAGDSKAIEVELTARQSGALTIKAQAFADGGLRAEVSEQVLVRRANLVAQIDGPKVKYAGTVAAYLIRIVNNGNATASNAQVAALLPPQAKYISSNSGGRLEQDQARVTWNAGTLQPGAERVFELRCSLFAPGENRMQTTLSADDDINVAVTTSTRVEALADLKLEVHDPQGPIPVGEDTIYEVVVRNRGTKSAEGVDLVVFFSDGLEAVAVQGGPHEIGRGQVVCKRISVLAAGAEAVYRIHTRAEKSGNHVFRAEVVCDSLNTKLGAEETTRFYGDDHTEADQTSAQEPQTQPALTPVPQDEQPSGELDPH